MSRHIHKLTAKVQRAYCAALEVGATKEMAAAYAGVNRATVRNWLAIADAAEEKPEEELTRDERKCLKFAEAAWRAEQEAGLKWQQVVDAAAVEDPNWAWKMLQVRYPDEYRMPPTKQEVSGTDGGAIIIRYADT